MKKGIICIILMVAMLLSLAACGKGMEDKDGGMNMAPEAGMDLTVGVTPGDAEVGSFIENEFIYTKDENVSTFSADVDTASYSNLRRMINAGYTMANIPKDAVRTEEMLRV